MVDVHHHFVPPEFAKATKDLGGGDPPPWTVQASLDLMDQTGFRSALLSLSAFNIPGLPPDVVRACNERGAKLVAERPRRFGLLASLPLPDVDASLKEIAHAFDTLNADGIGLMSNYGDGRYIGDPSFAPIHEELNRRRAVVFVHPHNAWYQRTQNAPAAPKFAGWGIPELPNDTTRAVLSVMSEGTAQKYPGIRLIFAHAGGTLPFMVSRIGVLGSRTTGFKTAGYKAVSKTAATFFYDLTNTVEPPSVRAVMALAPASNVLFGTDYPYGDGRNQNGEFVREMIAALPHVGLTPSQITGVARTNAEALFPRLKERPVARTG
jgi:aminocarboxymuconate-semialdehyde decarboxylase